MDDLLKKILFVSRYVDPNPVGSNANVFLQAKYLNDHVADSQVEVLTWPKLDLWSGPVPAVSSRPKVLTTKRDGLTYYVFRAPDKYEVIAGGAELSEDNWEQAVAYGMQLLSKIIPDIVHLQHRHGFWWILESAPPPTPPNQKFGILPE